LLCTLTLHLTAFVVASHQMPQQTLRGNCLWFFLWNGLHRNVTNFFRMLKVAATNGKKGNNRNIINILCCGMFFGSSFCISQRFCGSIF